MDSSPFSSDSPSTELADLLSRLGDADSRSKKEWDRLFQVVYDEFHRLAGQILHTGGEGRTITPTVLVNEAYLHMSGGKPISWESRAHFFGIAARAMRQVLARYSEQRRAQKRGGDWQRITLLASLEDPKSTFDFMDLNAALDKLSGEHARMAQVCELKFFAGLASREAAEVLGVSRRTVESDWALARKWLSRELSPDAQ